MLSVRAQPTAAGRRSLWRPGVSSSSCSSSDRSKLTPVSSDVAEVASSSSIHRRDAGFRQLTPSSASTEEQQHPETPETSSSAAVACQLIHFSPCRRTALSCGHKYDTTTIRGHYDVATISLRVCCNTLQHCDE